MKKAKAHLLAAALSLLGATMPATADPILVVPKGFTVQRVAREADVQFPMFACFDDSGALYVAESSGGDLYAELQQQTRRCRISRLTSANEEGAFRKTTVFSDQLVFPMGLVWRDGKLYVADPPDLVTLEDTDHDGRSDKRTVILSGFGHTDNGSLHGLIFGPDGWLYMTTGRPDGYRLKRADGSILSGISGALLRCRPDGSAVEVVSRGFENLVEVAFMPAGEIVGTDNWFSLPAGGVRDALVHLVEGGLYPLDKDERSVHFISGEPLPALAMYPAVALSGLTRYRAATFPAEYKDVLFSAQHNARKVVRHRLERPGSTFRSIDQDFLTTDDPDFHPSDVLEDADGSLLVIDTGSWYIHHCPTGRIRKTTARGGIYRVRFPGAIFPKDPRGLNLDWAAPSAQELVDRLDEIRPAVRERAGAALIASREGAIEPLQQLIQANDSMDAREEGIWVLEQIGSEPALSVIRHELEGREPQFVALAARAVGRYGDKKAAPKLQSLLVAPQPNVRLAAAEALARCGDGSSVSAIVQALTSDADRFLEHALVYALHRLATQSQLAELLTHPSPAAQKAGLILLDQPPHNSLGAEEVVSRLLAKDHSIRATARFVFGRHSDWIPKALPMLRKASFKTAVSTDELETVRELFAAFASNPQVSILMAEAISATDKVSDALRGMLIETMRRLNVKEVPGNWIESLRNALASGSPQIKAETIRTVRALRIRGLEEALISIARNSTEPTAVRVDALLTGLRKNSYLQEDEFALVLAQLDRNQNSIGRFQALEILNQAKLQTNQLQILLKNVADDPLIAPTTVLSVAQRSGVDQATARMLLEYLAKALESNWTIPQEQIAWLSSTTSPTDKQTLEAVQQKINRNQSDQLAELKRFEKLLGSGDLRRGRDLFFGKAGCSACHRAGDEGGLAGPDLTKVGAVRSGRDLVESILFPSATFAQGYEPYRLTLKNGDELSGVRARQRDDSFVLRDATGTDYRPAQNDIEKLEQMKVSLMPEGLLTGLSEEEVRNLFAFLQSLR